MGVSLEFLLEGVYREPVSMAVEPAGSETLLPSTPRVTPPVYASGRFRRALIVT
jgi:hypothetical protein